jgi:hypothetical protein
MIVTSLFVKIDTYIGETLFTADTTLYTADTTLFTADKTILEAGGYASEYQRVELYKDDSIKVVSSVQNYKDLSTITTDYSQTFTVPASKVNNEIFSYWYENAIDDGFDHRIRYKAFLEVDGVLFRQGNIQIEKANKNNGYIENYYITFYGDLVQLNDLFKEDKLQVVFNTAIGLSLNHPYTPTEVINRITSFTNYNVNYPLIASNGRYEYMTGTAYDVSATNSIMWDELFPAVPVSKVINMIEQYYGITFTGSFLSYQQYTKLWLYLKNAEELTVKSEQLKVLFTSRDTELDHLKIVWLNGPNNVPYNLVYPVSPTSIVAPMWIFSQFGSENIRWRLKIIPTVSNISYDVIVKRNGQVVNVFYNNLGTNDLIVRQWQAWTIASSYDRYEFFVQSADIMMFTNQLSIDMNGIDYNGIQFGTTVHASGTSQTTSGNISLRNYVPDITVSDFFTGILKLFNMLVIPTGANSYELVPTELYYASGRDLDLTKYFYSEQMESKKPQLFKQIEFKYETSPNILNNQFRGLFNRDYGDLLYNNENFSENNTYEVSVPFENVMFEKNSIDYNFLSATIWDKDQKPYIPKPMLMYKNGVLNLDGDTIRINTGTSIVQIGGYVRYSNELLTAGSDLSQLLSLNFGSEISPYYLTVASQSLYERHYSAYIENLYSIKARVVNIKAKLDAPMMANIKLNDQIFIRDKRYTINTMTMDLTTGETDFELLTNLRPMDSASSIGARASAPFFFLDKEAQTVQMQLFLLNNREFELLEPHDRSILTYDASGVQRQDYTFEFAIPQNDTLDIRFDYLEVIYTTTNGARQTFQINVMQDL